MGDEMDVLPFYYPTTIMLVDDNPRFLNSISLQLAEDLPYRLFDSPYKALEFLEIGSTQSRGAERVFTQNYDNAEATSSNLVMNLDLGEIHCRAFDEGRFNELSVAIVDYDMPGMSGLELCRKLSDYGIRKILLTGIADEKIAVQAFNEGIIDAFVSKSDYDVFDSINSTVKRLQKLYFRQKFMAVVRALDVASDTYFKDRGFAKAFHDVCDKYSIVEYYMITNPDGFLMIDTHGVARVMMVVTESAYREHVEIARNENAPPNLVEMMFSRSVVPYFHRSEGYFDARDKHWAECLYPAEAIDGESQSFYYALIDSAPFIPSSDALFSFDKFLQNSDNNSQ